MKCSNANACTRSVPAPPPANSRKPSAIAAPRQASATRAGRGTCRFRHQNTTAVRPRPAINGGNALDFAPAQISPSTGTSGQARPRERPRTTSMMSPASSSNGTSTYVWEGLAYDSGISPTRPPASRA